MKGKINGICFRRACNETAGVVYRHRQNGDFYCRSCAAKINKVNSMPDNTPLIEKVESTSHNESDAVQSLQQGA